MEMVRAQPSTIPMATWGWEGGEAPFHTCITAEVQNSSLNASNKSLRPSLDPSCQVHGLCALAWCCDLVNKSEKPKVVKSLTLGGNLPFWCKPGESFPGAAIKGRRPCIAFSPQKCSSYGKFVLNKSLFRRSRKKSNNQIYNGSRIMGKFRLGGTSRGPQLQTQAHSMVCLHRYPQHKQVLWVYLLPLL